MVEVTRKLELLPDIFAVCRLDKDAPIPVWATRGGFCSITRTVEELSVVCPQAMVPGGVKQEGEWRALMVAGPLDFSLTGVLASLTAPLAREGISVFAVSTYDTDYFLVKKEQLESAIQSLRTGGHEVEADRRAPGPGEREGAGSATRKE
jgi:uncharacterized protein